MNIKEWAENRRDEMIKDIKSYIALGWDKKQATEHVLNGSIVGSGIKAQIRYEAKSF